MASLTEALGNLSRVVENMQIKVESQANILNNLVTKEEGQATLLNNLGSKVDTQATLLDRLVLTNEEIQATVSNNLVTKEEMESQAIQLDNLETKAESQETLLRNLSAMAEIQGTSLSYLGAQLKILPTFFSNLVATSTYLQARTLNNLVTKADLQTLSRKLEIKAEGQANLLNNLTNKVDMQATVLDSVKVTNEGIQVTVSRNLVTKSEMQSQAIQLDNLETKAELQETLLRNLSAMTEIQRTNLSNMEAQAKTQPILLNKLQDSIDLQTTTLNNLITKEQLQATLMNFLQSNVTAFGAEFEKLSQDFRKSFIPKRTVEGIIAGTWKGVVVIPLESGDPRVISSTTTYGVAFDWQARKVYWIDRYVGIKRANLDGTSMELVIADNSTLKGLAVDPVTGNFYYGAGSPKNEIRVCGRSGRNCAVVASGDQTVHNIYDIALHPSEGIMFWSNPYDKNTLVRSNMDGRNAKVIISEGIEGIYIDESSQRLYGGRDSSSIITSYDLNGNNRKVLLSGRLDPRDVAVDGDTVYFGNDDHRSVYSLTQNGQLALIGNTTGWVRHIALYGRNQVPSRRNPCHSSACPNVCVLNRESYTCL